MNSTEPFKTVPTDGILTVGQLRELLAGYGDNEQVVLDLTACSDQIEYANVGTVVLPNAKPDHRDGYEAVTLEAVNTFDARQF